MSTLTGEEHAVLLVSERDLGRYFHDHAKPIECMRVGLEAEFFGVFWETGKPLPYEGRGGVQDVLAVLAARFSYESVREGVNVIALKRGDTMITLEPGGQIELSAPPVFNVFEIEKQIQVFIKELHALQSDFPRVTWLAVGVQPFASLDEIPWVPKTRYRIMAKHFQTHGLLSHEMMKRTCTNQINFDYLSEENAMASLRVALGVTSIVTAMFANSAVSDGRPNGYLCRRLEIWNRTDPERTGLIPQFTRPGRSFQDYLDYLLDMPMIFIVRQGRWIPVTKKTFRRFIREGYESQRATLGDFELHLSTAFPEVRLKQYLEVRGVDCQAPDLIPAVAAFWKGLLYDPVAREEAWKLVAFATEEERLRLHRAVPKEGLRAQLGKKSILSIARELVELSCASLGKQKVSPELPSECHFVSRIRDKITNPGKSPAEVLLEKWAGEFAKNPSRLIAALSL